MKIDAGRAETIITIDGIIEEGLSERLLSNLNFDANEVDVYITSEGGNLFEIDKIIHILENNFDIINIYGNGKLYSAAFVFFFKLKANKRALIGHTSGMVHKAIWESSISLGLKDAAYIPHITNYMNEMNEKLNYFLTTDVKLNSKELFDIFEKEDDVYFTHERLEELIRIKNAE